MGHGPDEDVWGALRIMVQQRGVAASRCSKVKGHAAAEMVQAGQARDQGMRVNNAADDAVNRGFVSYPNSRRALADLHDAKAQSYAELAVAIQRVMLAVMDA